MRSQRGNDYDNGRFGANTVFFVTASSIQFSLSRSFVSSPCFLCLYHALCFDRLPTGILLDRLAPEHHHLEELVVVQLPVAVDIGLPHKLVGLGCGQGLAHPRDNLEKRKYFFISFCKPGKRATHHFELLGVDVAVAVAVKDLEGLLDLLGLVDVLGLLGHHLEELLEVDGAVAVHVVLDHQVEDLVLGRVLPDRPQDREQLLRRDRPASVLEKGVLI